MMLNDAAAPEKRSERAWTFLMSWTGRVTAIVGLCATIAGGVTWIITYHRQQQERAAQRALAQTQAAQGDYQASIETYAAILKSDPLDRKALDSQLNTAMLWAENFSVSAPEGQSGTEPAGRALDQMISILEAGLTRSKGTRAADVQAHLGWAHWLNQHVAEREFGRTAEENFRAALAIDPTNVYANAMLGNWMLQNGGDFSEAVRYLRTAVDGGKVLPFARSLEIGGLTGYDHPGSRSELVRAMNSMRVKGETLDPEEGRLVFWFCCSVASTNHAELVESLSAVPEQDAWPTYVWLESSSGTTSVLRAVTEDYIRASLQEIHGQRPEALGRYRILQEKLKSQPDTVLQNAVNAAVTRLTHS